MAGRIEMALAEMDIVLPTPMAPLAEYVPTVISGNLLFVSGQLPMGSGGLITGTLTAEDHGADGIPAPGSKLGLAVGAATLAAVPGVGPALARVIYETFRPDLEG